MTGSYFHAVDWNAAPLSLPPFFFVPLVTSLAQTTTVHRPQGWHGQRRAASAATNRIFRCIDLSTSLAAKSSTAASPLDDEGASPSSQLPPATSTATAFRAAALVGPAEWAGWECKFSGVDGKRVAVPEDYVPESLREWDVEVWGFETLTSEQVKQGPGEREQLYRKRARVFPEVGCALDNLSLEVNVQTLQLDEEGMFFGTSADGSYVLGKKPDGSRCLRVEAGLVVPGRDFGDVFQPQNAETRDVKEQSRVRVEYRVETTDGEGREELTGCLGSTITVTRERVYRPGFDDGLLYKGGGLDAQQLRGLLCSDCFGEEEAAPTVAALAGEWRCGPGTWSDLRSPTDKMYPSQDPLDDAHHHPVLLERPENFWESNGDATGGGIGCLLMRGGVIVRAGPWRFDSDYGEQCWGAAAAAASRARSLAGLGGGVDKGGRLWAVEVGWLLGDGAQMRREVSTMIFELATMEVVGAWRGKEERLQHGL